MKRIAIVFALFALLSVSTGAVVAQDASPVGSPVVSTSPSAPLLEALGYPTLDVSYDGMALTAPSELTAGRYLLSFTNTSGDSEADMLIFGPPEGMSMDDLAAEFASLDVNANEAPSWFYDITLIGGTDNTSPTVIDVLPGEWLLGVIPFAEGPTDLAAMSQKLTVTGDMPNYPDIDGAVQVQLADFLIGVPDTIPAGPTIFEVTNSGLVPHFFSVMKATGPITTDEAVNGIKMFFGMPDATPAASGSAADPQTWSDIGGTDAIKNGGATLIELDLEPGTYIAACFIDGPGDIGNHSLHGMTTVFTVQ